MQNTLVRVVRESGLDGGPPVAIRTIMVAAALMLDEYGEQPVAELLGAAVYLNEESDEPLPVEALQAFIKDESQ